MSEYASLIKRNYLILMGASLCIIVFFIIGSYLIVQTKSSAVYKIEEYTSQKRVGIVFGSGFTTQGPREPLQDRLNTAKKLLDKGTVEKLILSGDNRTLDYNEPQVMEDYLVSKGVALEKLQQDSAGRSTYESCERASKVFGVNRAVLISQETHLPRAIYLCEHFGIDSVGIIAEGEGSNQRRFLAQSIREVFARTKAVFNVYFIGEETILGEQIPV